MEKKQNAKKDKTRTNMKKHLDCASLLIINRKHEILLQLRDDKPGIASPGKIGTFGGSIEPGETPEEGMIREAAEELGGYHLKNFKRYTVLPYMGYDVYVFLKYEPDFDLSKVRVTEGQKAIWFSEADLNNPKLTRYAKIISKKIFSEFRNGNNVLE